MATATRTQRRYDHRLRELRLTKEDGYTEAMVCAMT